MAAVGGAIAAPLRHFPLWQLYQRRSFVFMLGYLIQIIWRNAHVKPQQAPNTPGLPSA
mgnify:CR=1 FL=1